jgi:predicted ATPase
MLQFARIQNFKAWRDTGPLELAPLTLLFGPNSSGKSSINHLLMMLRQTVRSSDRGGVFDFGGGSNSIVNLGNFRDVVFDHDSKRSLAFELEWLLDSPIQVRDPRSRKRFAGDRLRFAATVTQPPRSRAAQSEGFSYVVGTDAGAELDVEVQRDPRRPERWGLRSENYDFVRTKGRAWELPRPIQFYGFPEEALVYYQNSAFLSDLEFAFERQLGGMSYLGPVRSAPERLYGWSGASPEDVGLRGENAIQALLAARQRGFNWRPRGKIQPFQSVIATWLQSMGLIDSFDVVEIAPESDLFEVHVRVSQKSPDVKLTDVGFGVSQVLPVLVQCFYAQPNSTVVIEQPELHLHPSVQASLADLFIAATTARENGEPRRVQLLVESHSEHLLRRLQRRIAEEKINPADVAIYMCEPDPKGSRIERLQVDEFGDILNWPPDFFGNDLEDVATQAAIGIQRRLRV